MVGNRKLTGVARGIAALAAMSLWGATVRAQAPDAQAPLPLCAKADFETAVDEAGAVLRNLTATNKPLFQDKLRQLRDKRGWTTDQFLKEAAPFVEDEKINVWDEQAAGLLDQITSMGQEGSAAKTPDCALLAELRGTMKALVDTQTQKWAYMFGKIDAALAQ